MQITVQAAGKQPIMVMCGIGLPLNYWGRIYLFGKSAMLPTNLALMLVAKNRTLTFNRVYENILDLGVNPSLLSIDFV
jgi:hypothetical protein